MARVGPEAARGLAGPDGYAPGIPKLIGLAPGSNGTCQNNFSLAGVDSAAGYFQIVANFGIELLLGQKFSRTQVNNLGTLISFKIGDLRFAAVGGLTPLAGDGFQFFDLALNVTTSWGS